MAFSLRSVSDRLPPPLRQEWRALLLFAIIFFMATWLFYEIVEDMVWGDPFDGPDRLTYTALQSLRTPQLDHFMTAVTELGDSAVVIVTAASVTAWLIYSRAWRACAFWLFAVGGGSLINTAIKLAMHRARPGDLHYAGASVFSFPSGHSTTNIALYGFLLILVSRELPIRARLLITVLIGLFVGLIAFSRLYLGAHWLSDVAGGLAFGSSWLAFLAMIYLLRPAEPIRPKVLLRVAALGLLVGGSTDIALNWKSDSIRYAVRTPVTAPPVKLP